MSENAVFNKDKEYKPKFSETSNDLSILNSSSLKSFIENLDKQSLECCIEELSDCIKELECLSQDSRELINKMLEDAKSGLDNNTTKSKLKDKIKSKKQKPGRQQCVIM